MSNFIQLHILTSYPPSNPNRDDLGRPKTAIMGGATRLRISSQSLKRAWRESDIFEEALASHKGTRTKLMGVEVYEKLKSKEIVEGKAKEYSKKIAEVFGKLKSKNKDKPLEELEIEQLAHFSIEEKTAIERLVEKIASTKQELSDEDLKLLREINTSADIALFGRMLAHNPGFNKEASCQVAHAITVHKVAVEDDFFTAVDDLNKGDVDAGSAHMGETEFAAGLFYLYICIDKDLLVKNLNGDKTLAEKALATIVETAATVAPSGKQNSFANRVRASYILAEKGNQQPRSLSVAFLKPVVGSDLFAESIQTLNSTLTKMDTVYGLCADKRYVFDATGPKGKMEELKKFVKE